MDEHTLRQILREIAQEDVPVTQDRRKEITEKAEMKKRRMQLLIYASSAASILVMFLLSTAIFAFNQPKPPVFPDSENELVTRLNLQKTIGDVRVTLEWIYFDVKTIRLQYNVVGAEESLVREVARGGGFAHLTDAMGNEFTGDSDSIVNRSFYNQQPVVEKLPTGETKITRVEMYNTAYFWKPDRDRSTSPAKDYLTQYPTPPETVDLIFELNREGVAIPKAQTQTPSPEATAEVSPAQLKRGSATAEDVFRFEFSAPIYTEKVIEPDVTILIGDVNVRLSRVEITPAMMSVYLCNNLPEFPQWTIQKPTMTVGSQPATWKAVNSWLGEECDRIDFDVYYDGKPTTMTLRWDYFQDGGYMSDQPNELEEWEFIEPFLNERGFKLQFEQLGTGYSIELLNDNGSKPDGLAWSQLYLDVLYEAGLRERVYGPWEFRIEIP